MFDIKIKEISGLFNPITKNIDSLDSQKLSYMCL